MKGPASTTWFDESNRVGDEEVAYQERFKDRETGLEVLRLTSQPCISGNIYPEHPASTPDGHRFIFYRMLPLSAQATFWVADTVMRRIRQITDEPDAQAPVVSPDGRWFYYSVGQAIWRMSPDTFEREECYAIPSGFGSSVGIRSISADGKRFLTAVRTLSGSYGVAVIDLQQEKPWVVFEGPDVRNPHEQYSRNTHRKVLVQVNDGIQMDEYGNILKLVGSNGASLHVVNDDGSGHVKLAIGSSLLERVQGHQCWVGDKDMVITTLHRRDSPGKPWIQDRVVTIVPGESTYHVVGQGPGFTHVHTMPDGRFWVADCNRTAGIYVGSTITGRFRLLCSSGATFGAAQYTHPHPFFLGDGRTVGWNSDVTGVPHVYCARIPEGFLGSLE
jgi:hypothetical protein